MPEDFPQEAMAKSASLQSLDFNGIMIPAIGPKYAADMPKTSIAADFHVEISKMINAGILDRNSSSIAAALSELSAFIELSTKEESAPAQYQGKILAVKAKPTSIREREIFVALKYSLHENSWIFRVLPWRKTHLRAIQRAHKSARGIQTRVFIN
jgi:hypothetical protein